MRPTSRITSAPLTLALCALLAALAVARKLTEPRSGAMLSRFGALTLPLAGARDLWRLASYGLVHAGAVHLAVNLAALAFFGRLAERALGARRYLAVYLTASCAGAAAVALAVCEPVLLVGASASIFGLVGATLAWLATDRARRPSPGARVELVALGAVVTAQVAADVASPSASGAAHVGGALAGALLGVAFRASEWEPRGARASSGGRWSSPR